MNTQINPGAWGRDRATCAARLKRIVYLDERGQSARQIADSLGLSVATVNRYRRYARHGGWVPAAGGHRPDAPVRTARGYPPDLVTQVRGLYESGLSQAKVARQLNLSTPKVQRILASAGVAGRRRVAPRGTPADAVTLYMSGLSAALVADQLGVSRSTARSWLVDAGVAMRSRGEAGRLRCASRAAGGS